MRRNPMKYYFTTYGDIYAGLEDGNSIKDHKVIVQGTKWRDYINLKREERTREKLKEYGWVVRKDAIVKEIDINEIQIPIPPLEPYWGRNKYDQKYMFIIGAGASANCVFGKDKTAFEKDTYRPPLGNELFSPRFQNHYSKYPGVRQSLNYLQDANANIEELLENDWNDIQESNNHNVMSRHINIQFYLQEVFKTVSVHTVNEYYSLNLFAKLSDRLQRIHRKNKNRHFAFVSFNQDTILEEFLCRYFFNTEMALMQVDDYIEEQNSPLRIFKPHGSWNWGWKFPVDKLVKIKEGYGNLSDGLFKRNINFHQIYFELLGNHLEMPGWGGWGDETWLNQHGNGRITIDKSRLSTLKQDRIDEYYPAMLLPYRDKDEFTMPTAHFNKLQAYLNHVETLIIIGWKGNENVFNRVLLEQANKIRRVIIVDINPSDVEKHLQPLLSRNSVEKIVYDKGFEDFIVKGLEKELQ